MRKSTLRLYLPFLALIAAQALLIAFLPSTGARNGEELAATGLPGVEGTQSGEPTAAGIDATGAAGTAAGGTGVASGAVRGGAVKAGNVAAPAGVKAGDTSHCKGGKQFSILLNANPPCVPVFAGNNGGATSTGVTDKEIHIIWFSATPNDQVDAILAQQGLAVPYEQAKAFRETAIKFVEKHYQLYGRKIKIEFIQGDCPTTPPDYDLCNAEAQSVARKKPFAIIWGTPLYGSVFDIWANNKIISLGGWQFDDSLFNTRRPYRYDPWMNGTEVGAHIAEYYCKKMAAGNADHSGAVIHPTIGQRNAVKRRLGIITPEIEANTLAAKRVINAVKACGGSVVDGPFTYESNINTATQQTQTTVEKLIQEKVTTVACMCDPIAPAFLTNGIAANGYSPEFLITGTQFLDADLVGRLYNPEIMRHAFGVSTIPQQVSLATDDATRVWRDMGSPRAAAASDNATNPCEKNGCGIDWSYVNLLGTALQMAGPNLTPLTFEKGVLGLQTDGGWTSVGKPDVGFWKFGANDYTWLSDTREVYWSRSAISPRDGQQGAYIGVNSGRRYLAGQWAGGGLGHIPLEPN